MQSRLQINLEDVPDINVFIKNKQSAQEMARLLSLYESNARELLKAERDFPDEEDMIDFYKSMEFIINIYPGELFLECEQDNPLLGIEESGSISYTKEHMDELLKDIFGL